MPTRDQIDRAADREEAAIFAAYERGDMDQRELDAELRHLQREYRAECDHARERWLREGGW